MVNTMLLNVLWVVYASTLGDTSHLIVPKNQTAFYYITKGSIGYSIKINLRKKERPQEIIIDIDL